mgnify:CR=1 FL=1
MRVGVFGGCFNPVHIGHLSLIEEVLTRFELEKVLVVPNMNPYYKENKEVSFDLISKMINLAIDDKWNCEISTLESDPNKDYTTYEKFTKSNRKQGRTKDDLFEPSGQSFDGRKSDSFISKRTKARS